MEAGGLVPLDRVLCVYHHNSAGSHQGQWPSLPYGLSTFNCGSRTIDKEPPLERSGPWLCDAHCPAPHSHPFLLGSLPDIPLSLTQIHSRYKIPRGQKGTVL